jgi:transporter family-2 protein
MLEIFLALLAGAILPVQIGVNGSLRAALGQPIWAALASFFVGTVALAAAALLMRAPVPANFQSAPWMWAGGLLGAVYVFGSIVLAGKLSATTLVACIIAGQMAASLVTDHFGWLGFAQHSLSPGRLAGVLLLGTGVYLIRSY